MRRLLILRHAKTEPGEIGKDDRNRALVDRGRRDAGQIGAYMTSHALGPDRVVLSPARRVQETWKHLTETLRPAPGATTDERVYEATIHDIFGIVGETPESVRTMMVVGHNPSLHEAALTLIASGDIEARERLRENLPTAGLIVIDFAFDNWRKLHPQSGRLERFITPKSIEAATN
ncbi:SixA phosphatase family protein [Undibacter mobilis]|uniref:Histidine phosphatase family protein n=1 Tax=Undibacter mobilis TaxID=2292256 RepID=A0A371BCU8_9BRAD|nr:histidine phosphatase family protein [Undibacter mobilis]RDV05171.1 histidine phosphatase family protein [Undibacter mobilis]